MLIDRRTISVHSVKVKSQGANQCEISRQLPTTTRVGSGAEEPGWIVTSVIPPPLTCSSRSSSAQTVQLDIPSATQGSFCLSHQIGIKSTLRNYYSWKPWHVFRHLKPTLEGGLSNTEAAAGSVITDAAVIARWGPMSADCVFATCIT